MATTLERIIEVIKREAEETGLEIKSDISQDDDIMNDLHFDSIMLVQLVIDLEDEFGIEIGDEQIEPDLFYSITTLESFIREKLESGQ